jgi:hypothetical protein
VFEWNRLTDEEKNWVRTHDWCAAIIKNVTGRIGFVTVAGEDNSRSRHVVCVGKTNFFTVQSGF